MNQPRLLGAAVVCATVFFSSSLLAQSPGPKARIFAKYDTNKNGIIDGDEVEAVRKAFAADPKGEFAAYDTNHDGKLSDEEIANIKPPGGKKGGDKKSGGKQKSDPDAKPADAAAPKSDGK